MNSEASTFPAASDMQEHAADAAGLMKALGNESRLMILCVLADGERSVGDLNTIVPLSQSALSQHLAVLRREKIVSARKEAQSVFYSLAGDEATKVMDTLHDLFCGAQKPKD